MSQYNDALVESMTAICEPATRDSNDQLYPLVAAGDREAMDRMIEGNMSLVIDKVDRFVAVHRDAEHLRDDLISEGFVALTTAVNKMAEAGPRESPNPTGLISHHIGRRLQDAVTQVGFGASARTVSRGVETPKLVSLPDEFDAPSRAADPIAMLELRDTIQACCESREDKVIIRMRESGSTDAEIAERLNTSVASIYRMRQAIYERFLEKSGLRR